MESFKVKIKKIVQVTHDVLQIQVEKPKNYNFCPGRQQMYV